MQALAKKADSDIPNLRVRLAAIFRYDGAIEIKVRRPLERHAAITEIYRIFGGVEFDFRPIIVDAFI